MGGFQHHLWRFANHKRFFPARDTHAPFVARLQARKAELWLRRGEVVALRLGECKEVISHDGAHRMRAAIFVDGMTKAIAKKTGHRVKATGLQFVAQHVAGSALGRHVCFQRCCASWSAVRASTQRLPSGVVSFFQNGASVFK